MFWNPNCYWPSTLYNICPSTRRLTLLHLLGFFFVFFLSIITQIQLPWWHLRRCFCPCHWKKKIGNWLSPFVSVATITKPYHPLIFSFSCLSFSSILFFAVKVNVDLSSLLDSEDKKSKNKRGVLPKHATNIMRSWLFQHLMVRQRMLLIWICGVHILQKLLYLHVYVL